MSVVPFPPMKRPLVAILRGVRPEETEDIVGVLIDNGMTAIEIPLNSPDPFSSIEIAVKKAPAWILVGASSDGPLKIAVAGSVSPPGPNTSTAPSSRQKLSESSL